MSTRFEPLTVAHIPEAIALAQAGLEREARSVPALAKANVPAQLGELVAGIIREGIAGVAAMDGDRLIGYLVFYGPIPGFFGTVDGVFTPLHGHAISGGNRERLYSRMLQHAMAALVDQRVTSLAITAYAHDEDVSRALQINGFGIRNSDAIRDLDTPFTAVISPPEGYRHAELTGDDVRRIVVLENALVHHLRSSPTFFPARETSEEAFMERHREEESRFFVTMMGDEILGYIKITDEGETFISADPAMPNITGAYLLPDHRGRGVYESLLGFVFDTLRAEDARLLGVDVETLNPTALRFWGKSFDNYTYSHARRIDERVMDFAR